MVRRYPPGYHAVMAHGHHAEVLAEVASLTRDLRRAIPEVYDGFRALHGAAFATGGALAVKYRELIALAIAVADECDGCIASHARGAARAGASREEAAEALGVTILMGGGPATIWAPRAYAAFCEFLDAEADSRGPGEGGAGGASPGEGGPGAARPDAS